MVQEGYEYVSSFEKALDIEKQRRKREIPDFWHPTYYWNYMYFSSGLYFEQVKRYVDLFRENVLFILFDELVSNPENVYNQVCNFLEIDQQPVKPVMANPSKAVISPAFQFFLRKCNHRFCRLRRLHRKPVVTKKERDLLLRLGQLNRKPGRMKPQLKEELMRKYAEDIHRLSDLTQLDFTDWH
jgi:hypothetical protein